MKFRISYKVDDSKYIFGEGEYILKVKAFKDDECIAEDKMELPIEKKYIDNKSIESIPVQL